MTRSGRLSRGANGGESCADVNDQCHGWVGVVPGNQYHVMASPRVYAIYWDEYFEKNPVVVDTMERFFRDILGGRYMRQLRQYGVGGGKFEGCSVIPPDPKNPPPAPPAVLTHEYIETQLKRWIDAGKVEAKPDRDETNLLYVIFTPSKTSIGECLCGYHRSGRYDHPPGDDNLFWAAVQEWHHYQLPSPEEFADSCTWCVSHEIVEAFTNRDGQGYHTVEDCEVGDICECAKGCQVIKANVDGWWVETYWDNENQSCYPLHIVPRGTLPTAGYAGADGGANGGANGGKRGANGGANGGKRGANGGANGGRGGLMGSR